MPKDRYFLTGDAVFDTNWQVIVTIPKSQGNWVYGVFLGYLELLSSTWPWITGGESTPEDAAAIFQAIYDGIVPNVWTIGDLKWTAADLTGDSHWLACNGALYLASDFPGLFTAIGTTFNQSGDPAGQFRVPDLRGRVTAGPDPTGVHIAASWAAGLGGAGGEELHDLIIAEMPGHAHVAEPHTHTLTPHQHSEITATPTAIVGGLETPQPSAVPAVGLTGLASDGIAATVVNIEGEGGDEPHNNVQPTIILFPYILAII